MSKPAHTSDEAWAFILELEALEPSDTEFSGSYDDKPGYHNTRDNLIREGHTGDYSIQLPADKQGPGDLSAAVDWTFHSAQGGKFTNIRKYGLRVRAAWAAHDPRLAGWREVLCQADADDPADGYDFVFWTERTPDATHRWHIHFSKLRQFLKHKPSYDAMMSVLRGQNLLDWMNMASVDVDAENKANQSIIWEIRPWLIETLTRVRNIEGIVTAMAAKIDVDPAELASIKAAAQQGAAAAFTAGTAGLVDALVARIPGATQDVIEAAIREALAGGLILNPDESA